MGLSVQAESEDDFLTRKQAASFLKSIGCPISPRNLERMAAKNNAKNGPQFTRIKGTRIVRYRRRTLREWAKKRTEDIE